MKHNITKKILLMSLTGILMTTGCGKASPYTDTKSSEISVFIAASLSSAMEEIADLYHQEHPEVNILFNADSSGTLMQQIKEGADCDIFFSAATTQMDDLEKNGYIIPNSRIDLLDNKVVLITGKNSNTKVTGFHNLDAASSMALAAGSVPVGKYTRTILVNSNILEKTDDVSAISSNEISQALNGLEINECSNVSKVKEAVKEGANEIGTVYYSDAYSVINDIVIIAEADNSLSGNIVYPVALINNENTDNTDNAAIAADFLSFLQEEESLSIFKNYMFTIHE